MISTKYEFSHIDVAFGAIRHLCHLKDKGHFCSISGILLFQYALFFETVSPTEPGTH